MLIIIEELLSFVFRCVCPENENVLKLIKERLPDIVREVEVQGYILDTMISQDVIGFEHRHELDNIPIKENRARKLLEHILTSSNPRAAFFFLEALKYNYKFLVDYLLCSERSSEGEGDISSSLLTYNIITVILRLD